MAKSDKEIQRDMVNVLNQVREENHALNLPFIRSYNDKLIGKNQRVFEMPNSVNHTIEVDPNSDQIKVIDSF